MFSKLINFFKKKNDTKNKANYNPYYKTRNKTVAQNPGSGLDFKSLFKAKELHKRLGFTLFILVLYRFSSFIPLPGIDVDQLVSFKSRISGSFFGMFDVFSGGSLSRMTIMALNIAPYITSSILFQLLGVVSPYFANLKKQGETGRDTLKKYTKWGALVLSIIQGYGIVTALELMKYTSELVLVPGMMFRLIACMILSCSTMLVMWFGDQITSRGIGNGSSIIIYSGIVANLPSSLIRLFEIAKSGEVALFKLFILCLMIVGLFTLIVFAERIERQVEIHYTQKQISATMMTQARNSYLPIKLNSAGVLPPIFANTILTLPVMLLNIVGITKYSWGRYIVDNMVHGSLLYIVLYAIMIFLSSSVYSSLYFDCQDTAHNLNKSGGFIKGIRPGQKTSEFLEKLLLKISTLGGIYLVLICIIPEIMMSQSLVSLYFSGTSFIIVVGVAIDFVERVMTTMLAARYEKLFKKGYGGLL